MRKQILDDGSWFDMEKARCFEESSHHDGRNFISDATGSQWEHEALWLSRKGRWILNCWSQWQGSTESWAEIDAVEAHRWLIKQNKSASDLPDWCNDEQRVAFAEAFAEAEV